MNLNDNEQTIILNIINDLIGFPFKEDTSKRFDHEELKKIWKTINSSLDYPLTEPLLAKVLSIITYYLTLKNDSDSTVGFSNEEIKKLKEKIQAEIAGNP